MFRKSDVVLHALSVDLSAIELVREYRDRPHWGGIITTESDNSCMMLFEASQEAHKAQRWFKNKGIRAEVSLNDAIAISEAVIFDKDKAYAVWEALQGEGICALYSYNLGASLGNRFPVYVKTEDVSKAEAITARTLSELSNMAKITVPYKGNYNGFSDMNRAYIESGLKVVRGYKCFFCDPALVDAYITIGLRQIRQEHIGWSEWHNLPPKVIKPESKIRRAEAQKKEEKQEEFVQLNIFDLMVS